MYFPLIWKIKSQLVERGILSIDGSPSLLCLLISRERKLNIFQKVVFNILYSLMPEICASNRVHFRLHQVYVSNPVYIHLCSVYVSNPVYIHLCQVYASNRVHFRLRQVYASNPVHIHLCQVYVSNLVHIRLRQVMLRIQSIFAARFMFRIQFIFTYARLMLRIASIFTFGLRSIVSKPFTSRRTSVICV